MTDRPWGMTLGALGVRQCTGQLTLRADGKQYAIVFDHGAVIGASSPLASDSAIRVALIHHLIAPAQATEITRRLAADPSRAEMEVLAEVARLNLDQMVRLRLKVIEQRAARTFSVDNGEFVIDSEVEVPILTGLATDVRRVIYLGARMNLSAQRLVDELRPFGPYFALDPAAIEQVSFFGLTDAEKPILEALRTGTSLAELEAKHRDLDPRTVQAVVYSLVSCSIAKGISPLPHAEASGAQLPDDGVPVPTRAGARPTPSEPYSQTHGGRDVVLPRAAGTGTGQKPAATPPSGTRTTTRPVSEPRATPGQPAPPPRGTVQPPLQQGLPRTSTLSQSRAPSAAPDETGVPRSTPGAPRTSTPSPSPIPSRTQTPLPSAIAAATAAAKAAAGTATAGTATADPAAPSAAGPPAAAAGTATAPSAGAGQPSGQPSGLPPGPAVARTPTPPPPDAPVPSRTRTPLAARTQTPSSMPRTKSPQNPPGAAAGPGPGPGPGGIPRARTGSVAAPAPASAPSDPTPADAIVTDPVAAAKSAHKRGQARLKADDLEGAIVELARAVELQPAESDYAATLAWARFCHAADKQALAQATREALNKAIRKSQTPELAQFYLGRVERMLGRDKEALRLFQEVLEAQPRHADAAAEIRVIEARLAEGSGRDGGGGGLFGRKR